MKKIAALGFLLLAGCAPNAETPLVNSAPTILPALEKNLFEDTSEEKEGDLLADAGARLVSGRPISEIQTLRCLRREKSRPQVKGVCLLMAAKFSVKNAEINREILAEAQNSEMGAIALGWQPQLVKEQSFESLQKILKNLENAPAYLSTRLAKNWIYRNPAENVISYLREILKPGQELSGLRAYFDFWGMNDPAFGMKQVSKYCHRDALDEASWRCLRLKTAMGNSAMLYFLRNIEPGGNPATSREFELIYAKALSKITKEKN